MTATSNSSVSGGNGNVSYDSTGALSANGVVIATAQNTVSQGGVPMILQSSGSVGVNGAVTLTTALDNTYPNCYLYFPTANAVFSGSAPGWYYTTMTSATAGTVFNNNYSLGTPTIPATPLAITSTAPGAYTQSIVNIAALTAVVPANSMGPNGNLEVRMDLSTINNANTKNQLIAFGGVGFMGFSMASIANIDIYFDVHNQGKTNRQHYLQNAAPGAVNSTIAFNSIDTTQQQTVQIQLAMAVATDYVVLQTSRVTVRSFP